MEMLPSDIAEAVQGLLQECCQKTDGRKLVTCQKMHGDGSNRRLWRITTLSGEQWVILAPEKEETTDLLEARAGWEIGRHLFDVGVPVPECIGFDQRRGLLLCEDLGDRHLQTVALATDYNSDAEMKVLRNLYRETLDGLVKMQIDGSEGFQPGWCWDTAQYDKPLMLERESGYFVRAFWQGILNQEIPVGLENEFTKLAEFVSGADSYYFLHRDFQSRNVMVANGQVRFIDFQGGRLGPLGYDVASLLIDPYAGLPDWFRNELLDYYLTELEKRIVVDAQQFYEYYVALSLQRNLQILGAFAFLSTVRGKLFFFKFIEPALRSLKDNLCLGKRLQLPILTEIADKAEELFNIYLIHKSSLPNQS